MDLFYNSDALMALITLTFLEIVLGVDNIIFISIAANKVEPSLRKKAVNYGLFFALALRIILLLGLSFVIEAEKTLFSIDWKYVHGHFSGQSIKV